MSDAPTKWIEKRGVKIVDIMKGFFCKELFISHLWNESPVSVVCHEQWDFFCFCLPEIEQREAGEGPTEIRSKLVSRTLCNMKWVDKWKCWIILNILRNFLRCWGVNLIKLFSYSNLLNALILTFANLTHARQTSICSRRLVISDFQVESVSKAWN